MNEPKSECVQPIQLGLRHWRLYLAQAHYEAAKFASSTAFILLVLSIFMPVNVSFWLLWMLFFLRLGDGGLYRAAYNILQLQRDQRPLMITDMMMGCNVLTNAQQQLIGKLLKRGIFSNLKLNDTQTQLVEIIPSPPLPQGKLNLGEQEKERVKLIDTQIQAPRIMGFCLRMNLFVAILVWFVPGFTLPNAAIYALLLFDFVVFLGMPTTSRQATHMLRLHQAILVCNSNHQPLMLDGLVRAYLGGQDSIYNRDLIKELLKTKVFSNLQLNATGCELVEIATGFTTEKDTLAQTAPQ
jgi:hypothetical protein